MVKRCVAAGCSNTYKDEVSLFLFPKDPQMRKKWADQVKRTRDKWDGPTDHSVLCSSHFEEHCFEADMKLAESLGVESKKKPRLKSDAVPTLFQRPVSKRPSTEGVAEPELPKKMRRVAYEKRERQRLLDEAFSSVASSDPPGPHDDITPPPEAQPLLGEDSFQTGPFTRDANVQVYPVNKTKGVQAQVTCKDCAVQCCLIPAPPLNYGPSSCPSDVDTEVDTETEGETDSSSYVPSEDTTEVEGQRAPIPAHQQKKYFVFEDSLMELFDRCEMCGKGGTSIKKKVMGTFIHVKQSCKNCNHMREWDSQPFIKNIPTGNILLSASILFGGGLPSQVLRILDYFGCAAISLRTFFNHQRSYLQPTIFSVWHRHQLSLLSRLKSAGKKLTLGGDGRADSPGHSAKYGSYTVMDLEQHIVLDMQLVQSNEVKGSYHMEMEGLVRSVSFLKQHKLDIGVLVTDRHTQISKWMRENLSSTDHRYDAWHLAKSLRKKLEKVAKEKECELIREWIKSVINHLYWSAVSTPSGDGEKIKAKWLSLDNHIHNKHSGHGKVFPKCEHGRLPRRGRKKWFKPHTKSSEKISAVITRKAFCSDVAKLSPVHQTSRLEAYHSVVIHFAPKSAAFTYLGMLARLQLAALHYNENSKRGQAKTKTGDKRYAVQFPKYKKGGYIVRKLLAECT